MIKTPQVEILWAHIAQEDEEYGGYKLTMVLDPEIPEDKKFLENLEKHWEAQKKAKKAKSFRNPIKDHKDKEGNLTGKKIITVKPSKVTPVQYKDASGATTETVQPGKPGPILPNGTKAYLGVDLYTYNKGVSLFFRILQVIETPDIVDDSEFGAVEGYEAPDTGAGW